MFRSYGNRTSFGSPQYKPVISPVVEADKSDILKVLREYFNKQQDKAETLTRLSALESKLSAPS